MKKRMKLVLIILSCVLSIALVSIYSVPKLRAVLFVKIYHELIEQNLRESNGTCVPAGEAVLLGYKYVNNWENSHPMTEFIIMTYGDTYYGCYYSSDDVPVAFQNTDVPLSQEGKNSWKWISEGDNRGFTSKIMERWYYFKASL